MPRCAARAHSGDRWRGVSHRARAVVCTDTCNTGTESFLEAVAARRMLYSVLVSVRACGATAPRRSGGSGTIASHLTVGSTTRARGSWAGVAAGNASTAEPDMKTALPCLLSLALATGAC